jgi:hypothetical protein
MCSRAPNQVFNNKIYSLFEENGYRQVTGSYDLFGQFRVIVTSDDNTSYNVNFYKNDYPCTSEKQLLFTHKINNINNLNELKNLIINKN